MRTITIGFSKPKKIWFPIASWLIRLYQNTEYSHTYISFDSPTFNREIVYEAVGAGVRFVGAAYWKEHATTVKTFTIEVKECNYITIMQYCIDHAGLDYGFLQNIGIYISNLFNLKSNIFKKGKNCSEVLAEILHIEGYKFDKEYDLIMPIDIYKALEQDNKHE